MSPKTTQYPHLSRFNPIERRCTVFGSQTIVFHYTPCDADGWTSRRPRAAS